MGCLHRIEEAREDPLPRPLKTRKTLKINKLRICNVRY